MTAGTGRRAGQPLVVVIVLLLIWSGGRALLWQTPWPGGMLVDVYRLTVRDGLTDPDHIVAMGARTRSIPARRGPDAGDVRIETRSLLRDVTSLPVSHFMVPPKLAAAIEVNGGPVVSSPSSARSVPDMAALSGPQPYQLAPGHDITSEQGPARRWSGDAWLLLRDGSGRAPPPSAGPLPASYGASQAGAVLRFALVPDTPTRLTAHLRASKALIKDGESEAALGANMRPIPGVPVIAHAEVRATRIGGQTLIRPAAFVTTGVDVMPLPLGARLRGYAQAGYVGGQDATAFVDGQAVADRSVLTSGTGSLNLGAGAWGGAQQGAERLDVGPSASITGQVGTVPLRLSVDYRLRVAGQAAPNSGAVLTLSTGF